MKTSIVVLKLFSLLTLMLLCLTMQSQTDTLMSSIGYKGTYGNRPGGNSFKVDSRNYPDLSQSKLFYIEISEEETQGNTGLMGPNYKKINSNLTGQMLKNYPYDFKVFSNTDRLKSKDFFLEEGYTYRLLIHSDWYSSYNANSHAVEWNQSFSVAIQNIETETIFDGPEWFWAYNYVKKFIAAVTK